MCGIAAICTGDNINDKIFKLLLAIQHRGQDSYGFSDGLVSEKFEGMIKNPPSKLSKNIALAHTRYITNGILTQPLERDNITLVHNGHIEIFEKSDKSDSQVLLDYIVENKSEDIIETIKKVIYNVESAFFVILIYQEAIYAFKDRYGIRPGLYGFDGEDILISSENNDNPFINIDIKPGEIISIKKGELKKYQTINYLKPCIFEYLYFARASSKIYGLSVNDFRVKLAYLSKDLIKNHIDVVCGVPSSSRVYGLELARILKKDYIEPFVKKKRSFILPTQEERENYVKEKYKFSDRAFNYNSVLIVDDSVVRGTTSKYLISLFKKKGCSVSFLSCSPKIVNINKYGINISKKNELISYNRNEEEIRDYLGCDVLIFQTVENLYKASGFKDLELSIYKD